MTGWFFSRLGSFKAHPYCGRHQFSIPFYGCVVIATLINHPLFLAFVGSGHCINAGQVRLGMKDVELGNKLTEAQTGEIPA